MPQAAFDADQESASGILAIFSGIWQLENFVTAIMVHLGLGSSNRAVLETARSVAQQFRASVIGIAACQPLQIIFGDAAYSGDVIAQNIKELEREISVAEAEFRAAFANHDEDIEWRSQLAPMPLADYIAEQARCADLVITCADKEGSLLDATRHLDAAKLVMQMGRPVLVVPSGAGPHKFQRIAVFWKDTRESRRALKDALPFLRAATHVILIEIAVRKGIPDAMTRLADVQTWLKCHGVVAETLAQPLAGDETQQLSIFAVAQKADLIVAGAYGHSRLREWVLGGVTRDLLMCANRCALVSH